MIFARRMFLNPFFILPLEEILLSKSINMSTLDKLDVNVSERATMTFVVYYHHMNNTKRSFYESILKCASFLVL